eukprot:5961279-Pyramimonas_sp.AAC.2
MYTLMYTLDTYLIGPGQALLRADHLHHGPARGGRLEHIEQAALPAPPSQSKRTARYRPRLGIDDGLEYGIWGVERTLAVIGTGGP